MKDTTATRRPDGPLDGLVVFTKGTLVDGLPTAEDLVKHLVNHPEVLSTTLTVLGAERPKRIDPSSVLAVAIDELHGAGRTRYTSDDVDATGLDTVANVLREVLGGPVVFTIEDGYGRANVRWEGGSGISSARTVGVAGQGRDAIEAAIVLQAVELKRESKPEPRSGGSAPYSGPFAHNDDPEAYDESEYADTSWFPGDDPKGGGYPAVDSSSDSERNQILSPLERDSVVPVRCAQWVPGASRHVFIVNKIGVAGQPLWGSGYSGGTFVANVPPRSTSLLDRPTHCLVRVTHPEDKPPGTETDGKVVELPVGRVWAYMSEVVSFNGSSAIGPFQRIPHGYPDAGCVNNCAERFGDDAFHCQICAGLCPDRKLHKS